MTAPRTYGDRCGIARALDVVGERWALLVVRELLLGPKRFTDLRAGLPSASPNVLAQRLRELEAGGLVVKRRLPPPAASQVYELTPRGAELEPVVMALGRWGAGTPVPAPEVGMSPDASVLSLKALFDPGRAQDAELTIALTLGEDAYRAHIAKGELELHRGEARSPDATIATDVATLTAVRRAPETLHDATRAGTLTIDGDEAAAERFLALFPLPAATPA